MGTFQPASGSPPAFLKTPFQWVQADPCISTLNPASESAFLGAGLGRAEPCALPQGKAGAVTVSPPLCPWQRFTQSMKLDGEMERLTLEHGTMLGPPTEEERAQEAAKKKLTNKVGHGGQLGLAATLTTVAPADSPSWFLDHLWPQKHNLCGTAAGVLKVCFEDPVSHSSPCTGFFGFGFFFLVFSCVFSCAEPHPGFLKCHHFPIPSVSGTLCIPWLSYLGDLSSYFSV